MKKMKLQNVVKRMIAMLTIVSMTVTGFGMMDSAAFNGVLSGDGTLSGNGFISGNADLYGNGVGYDDKVLKREDESKHVKVGRSSRIKKSGAFDDIILETIDDVTEDAKNRLEFVKVYDATYKKTTEYALMTNNYNQEKLNVAYSKKFGYEIEGTCAEVATTIISEYYNRKEKCVIRKGDVKGRQADWLIYFIRYIHTGIEFEIYDCKKGTKTSKVHKLYKPFYRLYNKNMSGDCDLFMLDKTIKKYNSNAKPVVGKFHSPRGSEHGMVILGYYDVEVYYKKNGENRTTTFRYYAVNDGYKECYEGNYRVQYIADRYIDLIFKLD